MSDTPENIEVLTAKAIAHRHMPSEGWRSDVEVMGYLSPQTRLVVKVESNTSLMCVGVPEAQDRTDQEFAQDIAPALDHLCPQDEAMIAEMFLRYLVQWDAGLDLSPAQRAGIQRESIVTPLLAKISAELAQAHAEAAKQARAAEAAANPALAEVQAQIRMTEEFVGESVKQPAAPDETRCPKCGQGWDAHDFGVPRPYCP